MTLDRWDGYLQEINFTTTARRRLQIVLAMAKNMIVEDFVDVFVTNANSESGFPEYINAWFFSENYSIEAKNFMTSETLDVVKHSSGVVYAELGTANFDFVNSKQESRLSMSFTYKSSTALGGQMSATGNNCQYLFEIYRKYMQSNIH